MNKLKNSEVYYKMRNKISNGFVKISELLTKLWVAVPILFGILLPMIYMFPLAFSSWWLFGSFEHTSWLNCYFVLEYDNPVIFVPLYIIEAFFFIVGCYIFLTGLITLIKARTTNKKLASSSVYKYIRHPQNVGILLILLPFSLYLHGIFGYDIGIRIGELISWLFLTFLFAITSIYEERKMLKKFGDIYLHYIQTTGFFFPKIRKKTKNIRIKNQDINIETNFWKLNNFYGVKVFASFMILLISVYIMISILRQNNLVFWTR